MPISGGVATAPSMVLLSSTKLGGAAATIDITSISPYQIYKIFVSSLTANDTTIGLQFNADSGNHYDTEKAVADGVVISSSTTGAIAYASLGTSNANQALIAELIVVRTDKNYNCYSGAAGRINALKTISGYWQDASQINRITLMNASGNFNQDTTLKIYGVS
jgi:hypothetical protein